MPHGHGLALAALFASYLIIVIFARDTLRAAYGGRYRSIAGLTSSLGG